MPRNRKILLALVVGPLYVLVLVALFPVFHNSSATVSVWVAAGDIAEGTRLTASDLQRADVAGETAGTTLLGEDPAGKQAAHPLHRGDVLRPDDIQAGNTAVVSITVTGSPTINPSDHIDVYATVGSKSYRVGHNVLVVSQQPLAISVPAKDAPLWVRLGADKLQLTAVLAHDVSPNQPLQVQSSDALTGLAGVDAGGSGGVPAGATPQPSPSPSGSSRP